MNYFVLFFVFFIFPILNNAQTVESNNSLINTPWFWPFLILCLGLLFTIPCTLIMIVIMYHKKKQLNDSNESSISSNSSPTPIQQRPRRYHSRFQPSHYVGGVSSPPPPYTINEHLSVTPSLPPSYESCVIENESIPITTNPTTTETIINVEPIESISNQSTNLNLSSISTNSSIQTFQV
ncbi:unnamed protein product [Rotaria sordida]|uniref:Uncharacterized protein n=2 Tax=Rotaria sordida TaxID=392033 RepID=A0A814CN86_9BILA|nr:unnamed protein product [Rotaria sordida]CAF0942658.1 unnamed protein product [Rotaria sordida]